MWNSLEIAKLIVAALAPASIGVVGYFINKRIRDLERDEWKNRKAIERRIALFDDIGPKLNSLYCFLKWVGDWQRITPQRAVEIKRELDKTVFTYRYILGEDVFSAYNAFMELAFRMYHTPGKDALIRATIVDKLGDRRKSPYYEWKPEWEYAFDEANAAAKEDIDAAYARVMIAFKGSIGL